MLHLIGEVLRELELDYVMLTGKVPVKKRGQLIDEFEANDACRIFSSTESGGSGLNLQMADVVINFELPWNPAKKNQRIGRIDRLGQKSTKLTVVNLIAVNTIETKIAAGLFLKQNLFDGVLSPDKDIDEVDFSAKGRAQFIDQLEEMIEGFENPTLLESEEQVPAADSEVSPVSVYEEEESIESTSQPSSEQEQQYQQLEEVLHKGMAFLSGIYQLSSGQPLQAEDEKSITIDRETGEVTMKFKVKF